MVIYDKYKIDFYTEQKLSGLKYSMRWKWKKIILINVIICLK